VLFNDIDSKNTENLILRLAAKIGKCEHSVIYRPQQGDLVAGYFFVMPENCAQDGASLRQVIFYGNGLESKIIYLIP
jgi:hypothetical protein